jgi:hypothetical protein
MDVSEIEQNACHNSRPKVKPWQVAKILRKIYYNNSNPASFGGVQHLYHEAIKKDPSITVKQVKRWLSMQDTYTIHRQATRKFEKNRVMAYYMDELWEADLVDMQEFAQFNSDYKYLLTVIDVLSKFAWAVPIKAKTGIAVASAFNKIFESGRVPTMLRTDEGKEFLNSSMELLFRKRKIHHYTTQNKLKACVVERFNRTLKEKMWKYFSANFTFSYMDVIDDLLESYRSKKHSRTKFSPKDVDNDNASKVFRNLYPELFKKGIDKPVKNDIKVGDMVRLVKCKTLFEKGYTGNWLEEIFKVDKINRSGLRPIYKLLDVEGEVISGTHYREEIQPVKVKKNKKYVIEKVLDEKNVGGRTQYLVKWFGYPEKFNSWVDNIEPVRNS